MKIAICVNGRPHEGGVTTYINTVVDPLRSLGHTVDVVTLFGVSDYREVKKEFVEKSDSVLKGRPPLVILAYVVSQCVIAWHLLRNHLKKRYDVIFAIDVSSANVALLLRRLTGARVFLRVGGSVVRDMVAQGKMGKESTFLDFFRREERLAYSRVDSVLPNSTWSYEHVKAACPEARLLLPIISPVNRDVFRPDPARGNARRQEIGVNGGENMVLFPSRLDPNKGPLVALNALREILGRDSRYRLVYVGWGAEMESIRHAVAEWNLGGFVHLLGMVSHSEMPAVYNAADVVIVPSVTYPGSPEEPMANCVIEAMACGTPVIASAIGGLKAFIVSGENGILVPEGDVQALAHEIECVVSDESYRRRLVGGGLDTVRRHCSPRAVASKLVEIFGG